MIKLPSVLLVDDDDTVNYLNRALFKKLEVTEKLFVVGNGQEALTFITQNCPGPDCPSLILLDINMPVMDGFEFLDAYKELEFEQKQSVVIVMLTTSLNPRDVEKVQRANIGGLVNKPLTKQALEDIIAKHFS